jgi:hypothetical protein
LAKPRPACAGCQRKRSVDDANNVCDRNGRRVTQQPITALGAAATFDDSVIAQLDEDGFEELAWHLLLLGHLARLQPNTARRVLGQAHDCPKGVFGFARQHDALLMHR